MSKYLQIAGKVGSQSAQDSVNEPMHLDEAERSSLLYNIRVDISSAAVLLDATCVLLKSIEATLALILLVLVGILWRVW